MRIQGFAQLLVLPYWMGLQPVDGDQVVDDDWVKQEQTVVARGVSQKAPVEGACVRTRDGPMKVS
jgi:hypothetical protein